VSEKSFLSNFAFVRLTAFVPSPVPTLLENILVFFHVYHFSKESQRFRFPFAIFESKKS